MFNKNNILTMLVVLLTGLLCIPVYSLEANKEYTVEIYSVTNDAVAPPKSNDGDEYTTWFPSDNAPMLSIAVEVFIPSWFSS